MLVIANGAFKSGSTWLFNITRCLTQYPPPPSSFLNPDWVNPSIHPQKLKSLISSADLASKDYLTKNHFGSESQRDLLLSCENVKVLDIVRDIRDVVVSAYYHFRRKEKYTSSFENYYWTRGRFVAHRVQQYHKVWKVPNNRVYVSSFKALKSDFYSECRAIGQFLKRKELSDREIQEVKEETSIESLRSKYGSPDFFRKGERGDWKHHLTKRMESDIDRIENGYFDKSIPPVQKARDKIFYLMDLLLHR